MLALVTAVKSDGGATTVHSAVLEKSSLERQMFEPAFFSLGCHLQPRDEHSSIRFKCNCIIFRASDAVLSLQAVALATKAKTMTAIATVPLKKARLACSPFMGALFDVC